MWNYQKCHFMSQDISDVFFFSSSKTVTGSIFDPRLEEHAESEDMGCVLIFRSQRRTSKNKEISLLNVAAEEQKTISKNCWDNYD